jgi:hypothetical protein
MGFLHREELEVRMTTCLGTAFRHKNARTPFLKRRERIAGIPNTLPLQDFTGVLSLAASDYFAPAVHERGAVQSPGQG